MCFHFLSIPKLRPKGTGTVGAANTNNSKFVSLVDVDYDLKSYVLNEKGILPRSERLSNFDCFPFFLFQNQETKHIPSSRDQEI